MKGENDKMILETNKMRRIKTIAHCGYKGRNIVHCGYKGRNIAHCGYKGRNIAHCGYKGRNIAQVYILLYRPISV